MRQKLVKNEQGEYVWSDAHLAKALPHAGPKPVLGPALGCTAGQLAEIRADAELSGFKDVEFRPSDAPGFYDCYCPNAERFSKYAEHCGFQDRNGMFSGKSITPQELESAEKLIRDRYPVKKERS